MIPPFRGLDEILVSESFGESNSVIKVDLNFCLKQKKVSITTNTLSKIIFSLGHLKFIQTTEVVITMIGGNARVDRREVRDMGASCPVKIY